MLIRKVLRKSPNLILRKIWSNCIPVIEMVPGWQEDISGCRTYEELPENARNYIETLERLLNHKIQMISVGARRDQYLMKEI